METITAWVRAFRENASCGNECVWQNVSYIHGREMEACTENIKKD